MRLRSTVLFGFLIAILLAGFANATTTAMDFGHRVAPALANSSPVVVPVSFIIVPPPPPPPPNCASDCLHRYRVCLSAGTNPGVCAAKYNYCRMSCDTPPILTQ